MGSLEGGFSLKRDPNFLRSSPFGKRPISRFARLVLFKKIDYLQWVSTVAVFFFFVVLFQIFLPSSFIENSENLGRGEVALGDFMLWKEIGGLDFGEDIKFEASKLLAKFQKESNEVNVSSGTTGGVRFGHRKPKLGLVFADLLVDPQQILMVTVAVALREIGYEIEVYSLEDGPVLAIWKSIGVPVTIFKTSETEVVVDWLSYDGVIVNSIEAREVLSRLLQEPFKSVPLIWSIHERTLATRLRQYMLSGQSELVNDWKNFFSRATVVVFPNCALPMIYSVCDSGNYFVIPGTPAGVWEADNFMVSYKDNLQLKMDYGPDNFVIVIVGSHFLYSGLWLEHAFVLEALLPLLTDIPCDNNSNSYLKIIIVSGDLTGNYSVAVEAIALNLGYPRNVVRHVVDEDEDSVLSMADLVIYGSFLEEQFFPDILIKAMCHGKPIIAPNLSIIHKYVDDRVNGYIFPKENIRILKQIISQVVSKGKLTPLARNIASIGKRTAENLMVSETVEGYASLVENVLKLPSEVALSKAVTEIPSKLKQKWQWQLFELIPNPTRQNRTLRIQNFLEKVEKQWNHTQTRGSGAVLATNDTLLYHFFEEEKNIEIAYTRKRKEEELLKDRTDQTRGTWQDLYRSVRKADRSKKDLHERDDGELERTGQPLCIYEPFFGEGTWPFLHRTSLYRGVGLSTKGRRHGADDIDAPSRLPLLNNPYYRDALSEFGAFFAMANRVDRIHKNAWIGFQSWRATARKDSLSKTAETALLDVIEARTYGDTLFFWVRMDMDPRNPLQQDFWSFCDAMNAGNCKYAFSETLKKMYSIEHDLLSLPPMPLDGDTWSVMNSWVLPTKSFLEFVMFSRMFVDALDAQVHEKHNRSGDCYLNLSKRGNKYEKKNGGIAVPAKKKIQADNTNTTLQSLEIENDVVFPEMEKIPKLTKMTNNTLCFWQDKHCYSRVLELLVNVWAYHSPRRMVYVNPETGVMQEQHKLKNRRGQMWVKWFSYSTLKSMDEDLAEEYDSDQPRRRWLWPSTGEVFWQGGYEKERNRRNREKERRRQMSKEKQERMRKKDRQSTIGKYVKPPPKDGVENSNSTVVFR